MRRKTYWPPGYRALPVKIPASSYLDGKAVGRPGVLPVMTADATSRARLEELRAVTLQRLYALQGEHRAVVDASRDSNADDEHDPEGATIAFERAQVDALVRDALARLESVDDAVARLDDGTYGTCARCGEPIAAGRLEARPTATTCVGCAGR